MFFFCSHFLGAQVQADNLQVIVEDTGFEWNTEPEKVLQTQRGRNHKQEDNQDDVQGGLIQNELNPEEPIELNMDEVSDISSEGFSEAQEEFDKMNSKYHFQARLQSQSLKCTCYCKPAGASSCAEIKKKNAASSSGYYTIVVNGKERHVFCYMGHLCGSDSGWTKVADFHMKRVNTKCPPSLQQNTTRGIRHCARRTYNGGSCNSVNICTGGMKYTQSVWYGNRLPIFFN